MAFGHDFTVAILYDGAGNDTYRYGADGFGYAINMSLAMLVDGGGDDTYVIDRGKEGFGITNFKPEDLKPNVTRNYLVWPVQAGLFLDAGGKDRYLERDPAAGTESPSAARRDGAAILRPVSPARDADGRHAGIFFDRAGATSPPIEWFRYRWSPMPSP